MSEQSAEKPAAEAPAPQPPVPAQDPRDAEIARLRGQVASLQAARQPAEPDEDDVEIKVTGDHSEFHFGNLHLSREFTAVPARLAAAIHNAAHEAGVLLTQKES